jgi:hypothetical protein
LTYIGLRSDIRAETCRNYEYVKKTNMYVHCLKETGGLGVQPRRKRKNTGFYYGAQSMRTTLIVITAFILVPFLFRIVRKDRGLCLCLDCHEFSSAPSHAQACKRLSVRSTQPASAQHSPRVRCQIRKERESGSAPKMRHVRGSAANHSGSSPGSPWHRQLASSRRSLTFAASAAAHAVSAAAHAVSAAPALGGHPAGFLTSQSTAAVPRSCPASRTTPPPGAASGLHAPAAQGPPGPGGPPSRPTLSALYGARP